MRKFLPYLTKINVTQTIALLTLHLLPLLAFWTGVRPIDWVVFGILYATRIFFVTGVYHRYFSHKSYKTSRWFQFLLALGAVSSAQRGVLWWAGHHRHHHWTSDTEEDIHSPIKGFFWSHMGWTFDESYERTPIENIRDFAKYPELLWLDRHAYLVWLVLAIATYLIGGWSMFLIGFVLSTLAVTHATFCINSMTHVFGSRRFATEDTSKNSLLLALITFGEGWHNNHHHYQSSARQGFYWWEIDITYYVLKVLSWTGLIWDLRPVPEHALHNNRVQEGMPDPGEERAAKLREKWLPTPSPIFQHLIHIVSVLGSVSILTLLVVFGALTGSPNFVVGASIFGGFLVLYMVMKMIYAYLPERKKAAQMLRVSYDAFVYPLLAATYTPLMLSLPDTAWGWSLFGSIWGLALLAMGVRIAMKDRFPKWVSWSIGALFLAYHIVALVPLTHVFTWSSLSWLAAGLIAYLAAYKMAPYFRVMRMNGVIHAMLLIACTSHAWFLYGHVLTLA